LPLDPQTDFWSIRPVRLGGRNERWVYSSAGEHYLDMVGVTGSIPVTPTISLNSHAELAWPVQDGCVAQRESIAFTRRGSQVQSLSHPPSHRCHVTFSVFRPAPKASGLITEYLHPSPTAGTFRQSPGPISGLVSDSISTSSAPVTAGIRTRLPWGSAIRTGGTRRSDLPTLNIGVPLSATSFP
jgi:hypothetical protein